MTAEGRHDAPGRKHRVAGVNDREPIGFLMTDIIKVFIPAFDMFE